MDFFFPACLFPQGLKKSKPNEKTYQLSLPPRLKSLPSGPMKFCMAIKVGKKYPATIFECRNFFSMCRNFWQAAGSAQTGPLAPAANCTVNGHWSIP